MFVDNTFKVFGGGEAAWWWTLSSLWRVPWLHLVGDGLGHLGERSNRELRFEETR
jgi:hypothetical protein